MDPYLEGEWWQESHETLAGVIRAQLVPQLPERYVALLAKRYVLDRPALSVLASEPPRTVYPDVHVVATVRATGAAPAGGRAALTPPSVEVAGPEPMPQLSVEIREIHDRRLVTLIEILSPANKRGDGAREFADRRVELPQTPVHLLEMDLLRGSTRIALSEPLPPPALSDADAAWVQATVAATRA